MHEPGTAINVRGYATRSPITNFIINLNPSMDK